MDRNPLIHAIGDVRLESPPGREEPLRRFYGELIGLREVRRPLDDGAADRVCFAAHRRAVEIRLAHDAVPSPMRRRVVIQVDSLEHTAERMRRAGFACWVYPGLGIGQRRLIALDPGGNRVELKQSIYL
jgi:extradiol dioxygenase family protein